MLFFYLSFLSLQCTSGYRQSTNQRSSAAFAALKDGGSVITWGSSPFGGNSSKVSSDLSGGVSVVYSTYAAFAALKDDGSVITWGGSTYGGDSSAVASDLSSGVSEVYSTNQAFAALKDDGSVITWGSAAYGGDSSAVSSDLSSGVSAIYSGYFAFAALKNDGSVITWGTSSYGGNSSAVASDLSSGVSVVYSSNQAFAALKEDGSVITWGSSTYGGDSSSVASYLNSSVSAIYSTSNAFAALKEDGSVITWGSGSYGGDSSAVASDLSSGVSIVYSTRWAFAALKDDGSVITWGQSTYGGDSSAVSSDLSSGVSVVYSTELAFAALKDDGSVVTWGSSTYGGASSAVASDLSSGVSVVYSTAGAFAALKDDGSVVTWGSSTGGGDPSAVSSDLNSGVVMIYSSVYAFAALKDDGSVVTWGDSFSGGDSSDVDLCQGVLNIFGSHAAYSDSTGGDSWQPVNIQATAQASCGSGSSKNSIDISTIIIAIAVVLALLLVGGCCYRYRKRWFGPADEKDSEKNESMSDPEKGENPPVSTAAKSSQLVDTEELEYAALPANDCNNDALPGEATLGDCGDVEMGTSICCCLRSSSSSSSSASSSTGAASLPSPFPSTYADASPADVVATLPLPAANETSDNATNATAGGGGGGSGDVAELNKAIAEAAEEQYSVGEVAGMLSGVADGLLGIAADHVPIIGVGASLLLQIIDICSAPKCAQEAFEEFRDRMEAMYGLLYKPDGIISKVEAGPRGADILKPFALRFENVLQDGITSMGRFTKKGFFARLLSGHGPEEEFTELDASITSCVNDLTMALSLQQLTQQAQVYEAMVDVKSLIEQQGSWGGVANMSQDQLKVLAKELGVLDASTMQEEAQEYLKRIEEGVNKVGGDVKEVKQGVENIHNNVASMAEDMKALTAIIMELRRESILSSGSTDTESLSSSSSSGLSKSGGRAFNSSSGSSSPNTAGSRGGTAASHKQDDSHADWLLTETPSIDRSTCLGEGSFGVVYAGKYKQHRVAIKVLNNAVLAGSDLKTLRREVRLHLKVSRLPGVVKIVAVAIEPNQFFDKPCIIMERAICSLHDALHKPKRCGDLLGVDLTLTAKLLLLLQIGSALECVSAAKMIHRDIKPANVLLFDSAFGLHAKLCDFGLSKSISGSSIGQSSDNTGVKGTPAYLSPESYEKKYSAASDMYAYIVLFNETLSGKVPFGSATSPHELMFAVCVQHSRPVLYGASESDSDEVCMEGTAVAVTAAAKQASGGAGAAGDNNNDNEDDSRVDLTADIQSFIARGWAHSPEERWTFAEATVRVELFLERALALMKARRKPKQKV